MLPGKGQDAAPGVIQDGGQAALLHKLLEGTALSLSGLRSRGVVERTGFVFNWKAPLGEPTGFGSLLSFGQYAALFELGGTRRSGDACVARRVIVHAISIHEFVHAVFPEKFD